jgi:hypothetical protein
MSMFDPISRDRHGRGLRRPLSSKLFRHGVARSSFFTQVVDDTCQYLKDTFPEDFEQLRVRIEDVPRIGEDENVRRWSARRSTMTITIYRIPIERFRKPRFMDPRMQIEHEVIAAAASLVDKDPWELIHPDR